MIDLEDHPFSPANIARESGESSSSDAAWEKWVADAERLLGHSLDGNDPNGKGEGYSLDEAFSIWRDSNWRPIRYVNMVRARARYWTARLGTGRKP